MAGRSLKRQLTYDNLHMEVSAVVSTPKSKRRPHSFRVQDNAVQIRKTLINYVLFDFGKSEQPTNQEQLLLQKMSSRIYDCIMDLIAEIVAANSIVIIDQETLKARNSHQTKALALCHRLPQELQTVVDHVSGINLNKYMRLADQISQEKGLIINWRKSDKAIAKKKGYLS